MHVQCEEVEKTLREGMNEKILLEEKNYVVDFVKSDTSRNICVACRSLNVEEWL